MVPKTYSKCGRKDVYQSILNVSGRIFIVHHRRTNRTHFQVDTAQKDHKHNPPLSLRATTVIRQLDGHDRNVLFGTTEDRGVGRVYKFIICYSIVWIPIGCWEFMASE